MLEDKRLSMSVFILEYTFITEGGVVLVYMAFDSHLGNLLNCGLQWFFETQSLFLALLL